MNLGAPCPGPAPPGTSASGTTSTCILQGLWLRASSPGLRWLLLFYDRPGTQTTKLFLADAPAYPTGNSRWPQPCCPRDALDPRPPATVPCPWQSDPKTQATLSRAHSSHPICENTGTSVLQQAVSEQRTRQEGNVLSGDAKWLFRHWDNISRWSCALIPDQVQTQHNCFVTWLLSKRQYFIVNY